MVDIVKDRIEGNHLDDRITAQQANAQDLSKFDVRGPPHPLHVLMLEMLDLLMIDLACMFERAGGMQCTSSACQTPSKLLRVVDIHWLSMLAAKYWAVHFPLFSLYLTQLTCLTGRQLRLGYLPVRAVVHAGPCKTLREAARVLRLGGLLAASVFGEEQQTAQVVRGQHRHIHPTQPAVAMFPV